MSEEVRVNQYRPDIDGLRAVAVSAVIANHFCPKCLPGGYLGVDIFFVISGYVITASLMADRNGCLSEFLAAFYARRIKRLLPALITCIAVTALLGTLFINPRTEVFRSSMRAGLYALVGLSNLDFFNHATDYFAPAAGLNLFTHTWSLGVEEQFYVVFPSLFWLSLRSRRARHWKPYAFGVLLAGLAIASWIVNAWLLNVRFPGTYFLMPPRFWELALGSLTFLYGRQLATFIVCLPTAFPAAAAVCAGIALALGPEREVMATSIAGLSTAALILAIRPGQLIYQLLTLRVVVATGMMSYSLYLWHWSVLVLSRWTVGTGGWLAALEVGAVVALSSTTYINIERPLRRNPWASKHALTICYGAAAVLVTAVFVQTLISPLSKYIYAGTSPSLMQSGAASLLEDHTLHGRLIWPTRDCVLTSNREVGKAVSLDRCTFSAASHAKLHILVVGNSFSAAEFEMYSAVAERGLGSVTATSSWGASPVPKMTNKSAWSKANAYYWNHVVPTLTASLQAGDVLVMINDLADLLPADEFTKDEENGNLEQLASGLSVISEQMSRRGIAVVFQTSNPFLRDAQCAPDMAERQWFNFGEPKICSFFTKVETLKRRKPLDVVLQKIRSQHPNVVVLDLMPIMCPDEVCGMTNGAGTFLYRDEWSHPSVEANILAQKVFLSALVRAQSATNPPLHDSIVTDTAAGH